MNSFRLIAALPLLTLGLRAQVASPQLPDRAAAAMTQYKGAWTPIIGAEKFSPIVLADGAKVTIEATAHVALTVGGRFTDGFVTISGINPDETVTADPDAYGTAMSGAGTTVIFGATLNSSVDLPDPYAVCYFETPSADPGGPPALAALVRPVGSLGAGKDQRIKFSLPSLAKTPGAEWRILIFEGPMQVRSTGMDDVVPAYLDQLEHYSLKRDIAARTAKGADAPIAVFRKMPLNLPADIKEKYKGQTLKVDLGIGADGAVASLNVVGVTDPALTDALGKGLGLWLFLPVVKGGQPTAARVVLPLKL